MKYLFLSLFSLNTFAQCQDALQVITEKEKKVIFCNSHSLQLSQNCSEKSDTCSLLKELNVKTVPSKVLESSIKGNPGSRICNALGWKVHMATLFDESQVCTCLHPDGEYVTCSSLSEFYQQKSKAKK